MTQCTDNDFVLVDAIASEAYLTLMVSCLVCETDLMAADLKMKEPNDPVEAWAKEFSDTAKKQGWSISNAGSILCPNCND